MERQDHERMLQWLDEALDGELDASRSEVVTAHLAECGDCREARETSLRLRGWLDEDKVEVTPGFAARVTAALPVESWEIRPARSLRWAVGLLLLLASSSLLLLSAAGATEAAPFALLGSIADLMATSALAGAGLLGATWRGVGLVLNELLTHSPVTLAAFALALVAVHGLLWRMLRPRRRAHAHPSAASSKQAPPRGD